MSLIISFNALSYSNRSIFFLGDDIETILDNNLYLSLMKNDGKTSVCYQTRIPTGQIVSVKLTNHDVTKDSLGRIISVIEEGMLELLSKEDKDSILKVALKNNHISDEVRPIPVMITIGWEYLPAGGDNFFMTIENMNNQFIYSNLYDRSTSTPGKFNYIFFVDVLKDYRIYIPFEIYNKYFYYGAYCSGDGIFRYGEHRIPVPDISVLAHQCYPGKEGIERYYEYFDNFNKGLSKRAPPLTHSVTGAMAGEYFDEDLFDSSSELSEEQGIPTLDDSLTSTLTDVNLPRKQISSETLDRKIRERCKKDSLATWQAIFKELASMIDTNYLEDLSVQEAIFIYQAQLFVNNANFSVDEKLRLQLPSSPLQNQEKNLYLRTDKNFPIFPKSKTKIFNIPSESIFINVGIEGLESTLKNYCCIHRISSMNDIKRIIGTDEEDVASFVCFLIDDNAELNQDFFENTYHRICQKTNFPLEKVKEKYIICQIKQLGNIYALIYPDSSKELRDRLNILTSLGHVPDLVTFYRSLFRFFKSTQKNPNINIFAELFKALGFGGSLKVEKPKPFDAIDIRKILFEDSTHPTYFHQYIKNIGENLGIMEVVETGGEIGKFIGWHFCETYLRISRAVNLDDFIFQFQSLLELLSLVIDIKGITIESTEILKAKIEINQISIPYNATYVLNYGMSAFTAIINALFDSFENCTIEIFNQGYFELLNNMDNLQHTVKRIKYTDDISTESSIVFIDMHPNNAVEKELYSHNVRKLFDRLYLDYKNRVKDSPGIYKTKKTIVIDATVNIMFDIELIDIIKEAAPLVESGLINLIIVQSLTKFHQLSADKFSAGILYLMNNNGEYWTSFNERLKEYCVASQPDRIVRTYFAAFCEYGSEALMRNHDKINGNTKFLYDLVKAQLAHFNYSRDNFLMEMTSSIDDGSSYISFNYRKLTRYMYQAKFISDKHISNINKEIIKFIVRLSNIQGIQLTQRQSIGFGVCNIGECDFAIRLTVGLEQVSDLQKLARILTYVCYALMTGGSQIESTEQLKSYLINVEELFTFLTIEDNNPNKSPISFGSLDISSSYSKLKADIVLKNTDDAKKQLIGVVENKAFNLYTTYLSKKGEPKRKLFSELPMLIKLALCLFIRNNQETHCKIVFNNIYVLDIPNFINVEVDGRSEFIYSSDQYGLLQFILIENRLSVLNKKGQTLLTGDDVDIHRDVLENFGVSLEEIQTPSPLYSPEDIEEIEELGWQDFLSTNFSDAEQIETASKYATFSSLPTNVQHQLFEKLSTTHMVFTNDIDLYSKKSVPVKISIESKNYLTGNGFHLERFKERDTTEYHLSIFSIKPPILNLFCQYVCLISVYAFLSRLYPQRYDEFSFIFEVNKFINESELTSNFSTIIQLFLKHNREIRKIVEDTNADNPDRLDSELHVLKNVLLFLADYHPRFKIIFDEQNPEAKQAQTFCRQLLYKYYQTKEPEKLPNKPETIQDEISVAGDQAFNPHVESTTVEPLSDINRKLFEAARDGRLDDVITLINQGARINSQHDDRQYGGKTALFIAAEIGHSHIVDTLIEYGADINIRDNGDWSPYDVALVMEHQHGRSACSHCVTALKNRHLFEAAYKGDVDATVYWLNQGTKINSKHIDRHIELNEETYEYRETTALFIAQEMGHHALIKRLLENGSHPAGLGCPYDAPRIFKENANAIEYFKKGDFTKAYHCYKKIVGLLPSFSQKMTCNLAEFYNKKLGRMKRGLEADKYGNQACEFYKKQHYERAIELFHKSLDLFIEAYDGEIQDKEDIAKCYYNLGSAYCEFGNKQEADIYLKKALELYQNIFGTMHDRTIKIETKYLRNSKQKDCDAVDITLILADKSADAQLPTGNKDEITQPTRPEKKEVLEKQKSPASSKSSFFRNSGDSDSSKIDRSKNSPISLQEFQEMEKDKFHVKKEERIKFDDETQEDYDDSLLYCEEEILFSDEEDRSSEITP